MVAVTVGPKNGGWTSQAKIVGAAPYSVKLAWTAPDGQPATAWFNTQGPFIHARHGDDDDARLIVAGLEPDPVPAAKVESKTDPAA